MKTTLIATGTFVLGIAVCLGLLLVMSYRAEQMDASNAPVSVAFSDGHGSFIQCARIDQHGRAAYACGRARID